MDGLENGEKPSGEVVHTYVRLLANFVNTRAGRSVVWVLHDLPSLTNGKWPELFGQAPRVVTAHLKLILISNIANTWWNTSTVKCSLPKDSTSCRVLAFEHACHLLIGESLVDINTSKVGILQLRHRMTQELMAGRLTAVEQVAIPLAEESPLQSPTSAVQTPFAAVHSRFMAVETPSPRVQSLPITAQIVSSAMQTPSPSSGMRSPIIPVQTPSPGPQCPPIVVQIASSATQTPSPGVQGPLIAMQTLSVLSGFLSNAFTMCVTEILSLLPHQNFRGKNQITTT